jgi:hypothetical protein
MSINNGGARTVLLGMAAGALLAFAGLVFVFGWSSHGSRIVSLDAPRINHMR